MSSQPIDGSSNKPDSLQVFNSPNLISLNTPMSNILKANGIPPAKVVDHVNEVRAEALKLSRWVCVRLFEWTVVCILQHPRYAEVLSKLKSDQSAALLDIGCFMSQETRQMIYAGVDSRQLAALDVEERFFDLGYKFFNDLQTNSTKFFKVDILDTDRMPSECLGAFDFIWACRFFHIWNYEVQIQAAINAIRLLKDTPGVIIFGQHLGNRRGIEIKPGGRVMFAHSHETWVKLWREVAQKTTTAWKIKTWYSEVLDEAVKALDQDQVYMLFTVERIGLDGGNVVDEGNSAINLDLSPEGP